MQIPFSLVRISETSEQNLTVFYNGEMYVAAETHANFQRILEGVQNGDESAIELFDVSRTAQKRFDRLSERVTIASGKIYFDGEPVDNALTQQVVRFVDDGVEDFAPLVAFFEKVQTNPNSHSQEQLYRWLADRNITITNEGNFIAYKGVKVVDGEYFSISHGKAISNDVEYDGAIPNPLGAIVTMPRGDVQHDPSVGCHTGLHAGTWNYASDFAQGAVLTVEINPRDVVSVPTDCSDQKLRVCRYVVKDVTDTEYSAALLDTDVSDDYDGDEEVLPLPDLDDKVVATSYEKEYDEDEEFDDEDEEESENAWAFRGPVNAPGYGNVDLEEYTQAINRNYAEQRGWNIPDDDPRNQWESYGEAPWN